jgi:bifunctional non-homologous end joining protein LigD
MALEEYKRKRRFQETPEPPPKVEKKSAHRFVVQKHRASHLHYDFRLEMEGVLKSWAVPKGPSLDPADKRLAMMVEDHPVSYFHFEGIIPEGNYGAGTVMVWDTGTWEALGNASEMLKKGDLKFRLKGEKLKGEFVLAHMKSRRPGSKGNEWLLIHKKDEFAKSGFNVDKLDWSVLTKRSLDEIAGDEGSAEWQSNRAAATNKKSSWLSETLRKKSMANRRRPMAEAGDKKSMADGRRPMAEAKASSVRKTSASVKKKAEAAALKGAEPAPLPRTIRPMLATLVDEPFQDTDWLYEVKWDGYRALAYIGGANVRLVSRNQNDLTAQFAELRDLSAHLKARQAVLDGEVVALDEHGRSSFSLMQQRSGVAHGGRMKSPDRSITIRYYVFDLLYLDGYSLFRVDLEERKRLLQSLLEETDLVRYSEHFDDGLALYKASEENGLEGIIAKRRRGCYVQKRSREWLKMKVTRRQECVIAGYTDPRGGREHFGSLVLGLYNDAGKLVHVGNAGSGFSEVSHADMWKRLKKIETTNNPFGTKIESTRRPHWVKPEMVAEIKFSEWTHEGQSGQVKMRAPIFQGLRMDKKPRECVFEKPEKARKAAQKAEEGEAA